MGEKMADNTWKSNIGHLEVFIPEKELKQEIEDMHNIIINKLKTDELLQAIDIVRFQIQRIVNAKPGKLPETLTASLTLQEARDLAEWILSQIAIKEG
jgi:hypothetical protein